MLSLEPSFASLTPPGPTGPNTTEDFLPFLRSSAYRSLCTVPGTAPSFFFPEIPAKKDTSMFVEYVGVIKMNKTIFGEPKWPPESKKTLFWTYLAMITNIILKFIF